jgi:hypothetical protein
MLHCFYLRLCLTYLRCRTGNCVDDVGRERTTNTGTTTGSVQNGIAAGEYPHDRAMVDDTEGAESLGPSTTVSCVQMTELPRHCNDGPGDNSANGLIETKDTPNLINHLLEQSLSPMCLQSSPNNTARAPKRSIPRRNKPTSNIPRYPPPVGHLASGAAGKSWQTEGDCVTSQEHSQGKGSPEGTNIMHATTHILCTSHSAHALATPPMHGGCT